MKAPIAVTIFCSASMVVAYTVVNISGSANSTVVAQVEESHSRSTARTTFSQAQVDVAIFKAVVKQSVVDSLDMSHGDYPRWLVRLFPVSVGALAIGLLSVLYIFLAGFSIAALAGTYLIPVSLMALYYLLEAAERSTSR